jgi:hypothetical protein
MAINLGGTPHLIQMAHLALLAATEPNRAIPMLVAAGVPVPKTDTISDAQGSDILIGGKAGDTPGQQAATAAAPPTVSGAAGAPPGQTPLPVAAAAPVDFNTLGVALGAIEPPAAQGPRVATPGVAVQAPSGGPDPAALAQVIALLQPQPLQQQPTLGSMITGGRPV